MSSVVDQDACRPKPRGANVRAFIESVERGAKPKPDFFNTEPGSKLTPVKKMVGPVKKTVSAVKKPAISKKPLMKPTGRNRAPAVVIVSSCCKPPPVPPITEEITSRGDEDEAASSELNCPSEDSGHPACNLKYSGRYILY